MGQYHTIINLTRKETLNPLKFGDCQKLLGFGASGSGTMLALAVLLAGSSGRGGGDLDESPGIGPVIGRWAGNQIAIVGDYYEVGDVPGVATEDLRAVANEERDGWVDISEAVIHAMMADVSTKVDLEARGGVTFGVAGLRYDAQADRYVRDPAPKPRRRTRAKTPRGRPTRTAKPTPYEQATARAKR